MFETELPQEWKATHCPHCRCTCDDCRKAGSSAVRDGEALAPSPSQQGIQALRDTDGPAPPDVESGDD